MQIAKDTFLLALRDRLATVNPERTVQVRGALRPAVLAAEDELPFAQGDPLDCFVLRWSAETVDRTEPMVLHTMTCEITYATQGTAEFSGMDRGRVLSAMDAELEAMLKPRRTVLLNTEEMPATALTTFEWWSDELAEAAVLAEDTLRRQVKLSVFSLEDAA